jgi:predicted nucleotidyltransferase
MQTERARELESYYLGEVTRRVSGVLGDRLVGVWLVGSGASGDYDPVRSDIDVQGVATERLPLDERKDLVGRLEHAVLPNPARGLEFVLYAQEDLEDPRGPRLQLNLNTGARMEHHVAYDADDDAQFWFTIDVSIARQTAVPLLGPSASDVFPEPPRWLVAGAALEALDFWAALPGAGHQTVLTACRSWAWAVDGVWRSKGDSARWAMERTAPGPIDWALKARVGEPVGDPSPAEVDRVLAEARAALGCHLT